MAGFLDPACSTRCGFGNTSPARRPSTLVADCHIDFPITDLGSISELAICPNPLAREVMPLWHLDRVLDTQGGVHDSSTSAHAGRSPAAQLLRTHDSPLHPHRR